MTPNEAKEAIYAAIKAGFTAIPIAKIAWDNVPFETGTVELPWIRVSVVNVTGTQASLGRSSNRLFRKLANLNIQIFTKEGKGTAEADGYADSLLTLLQSKRLGASNQLLMWAGSIVEVGNQEDGLWQTNVTIPFQYESVA